MHVTTSLTVLASGACMEAPFIDVLLHIGVIYEWDRGPGSNEQNLSGGKSSSLIQLIPAEANPTFTNLSFMVHFPQVSQWLSWLWLKVWNECTE